MRPSAYRLTAVVGHDPESLALKVSSFCPARLQLLLKEDPVAITIEPLGHPLANRLLQALRGREALPSRTLATRTLASRTRATPARWRCYKRVMEDPAIQWVTPVESFDLPQRVADLCARSPGVLAAFVAEKILNDDLCAMLIDQALSGAITLSEDSAIYRRPTADVRRAVLADRRALLAEVPTYSAAQIGQACDSSNSNLSQRAAELRLANRLFGLRSGWSWRYPTFQFGPQLQTYPEMRQVLLNLPDELGWERLQWFMTPHEVLKQKTPLEAWRTARKQVVEAAIKESWRPRE